MLLVELARHRLLGEQQLEPRVERRELRGLAGYFKRGVGQQGLQAQRRSGSGEIIGRRN
jgi:hypothetical protein